MVQMGSLRIVMSDELEEEFRRAVADSKGMRKGNLSKAGKEAIKMWIEAQGKKKS